MYGFYNTIWEVKWAALPLCGKDSEKDEIQKIFWIVNNEYLKQFLCKKEAFYTKNTHRQLLKIIWKSNSESTAYGTILL